MKNNQQLIELVSGGFAADEPYLGFLLEMSAVADSLHKQVYAVSGIRNRIEIHRCDSGIWLIVEGEIVYAYHRHLVRNRLWNI